MKILLYADGACKGNQYDENIGAWAYRLECNGHIKEDSLAVKNTTNNIMELTAVIRGLNAIKNKSYEVEVISDSQYVIKGVNEWRKKWEQNGFKNSQKKLISNYELWLDLFNLIDCFNDIKFTHTLGHNGNKGNERVDTLCNIAISRL